LCVINNSWANVLNLIVFVIKALAINLEFSLYIKLLSVKVYIIIFAKEPIKVIYFSLLLYVYNIYIIIKKVIIIIV
jgi:hypothetical protein